MSRKSRRIKAEEPIITDTAKQEIYPTAIYARLSVENLGRENNEATIRNQIDVCKEYVSECPDLNLVKVYQDM